MNAQKVMNRCTLFSSRDSCSEFITALQHLFNWSKLENVFLFYAVRTECESHSVKRVRASAPGFR